MIDDRAKTQKLPSLAKTTVFWNASKSGRWRNRSESSLCPHICRSEGKQHAAPPHGGLEPISDIQPYRSMEGPFAAAATLSAHSGHSSQAQQMAGERPNSDYSKDKFQFVLFCGQSERLLIFPVLSFYFLRALLRRTYPAWTCSYSCLPIEENTRSLMYLPG